MSLISSLNIAQQALSANQAAITVVSNNVANVDNKNYSKLNVELASVVNYTPSSGNPVSIANSLSGVEIADINRSTDTYLQKYYWEENSTASYLNQYYSVASNIEDIVNELNDTGLSKALTTFYQAVNALNSNPTDITARQNYVSASENICYVFNNTYNSLTDLQQSLVGNYNEPNSINASSIADQAEEVNTLLDQLADVNSSILKTNSRTSSSSALLDQRDAIISSLTSLIPVNVVENSNGTVNVSLGKNDLLLSVTVKGNLQTTTGTASQPAVINVIDPNDNSVIDANINSSISSGSIGAILDACGGATSTNFTINGVMSQLNTLAATFSSIMNNIQTGDPTGDKSIAYCLTSDGSKLQVATENIFTSSSAASNTTTNTRATAAGDKAGTTISTATDAAGNATTTTTTLTLNTSTNQTTVTTTITSGISAGNISVNSNMDSNPYLIAAGRLTPEEYNNFSKYETSTGNNDNATLIMNSRNTKYEGLGNLTVESYLASAASGAGIKVASIESDLENQELVLNQVETSLASAKGVNLDQELIDLIKFQRAYRAAARVFNICNELLQGLINLGN